jgi:hypothetical protein
MGIGGKKAGYLPADLYNEAGPITKLEPPLKESYEKKTDFEGSRLAVACNKRRTVNSSFSLGRKSMEEELSHLLCI